MEEDVEWGQGGAGAKGEHKNQNKHRSRYKVTSSIKYNVVKTIVYVGITSPVNRG